MIGDELPPGRLERLLNALPEGTILSSVLAGMVALAATIVAVDWSQMRDAAADHARLHRTEPMPLEPPEPGDQLRPYLPKAIPVGPDRGVPTIPGWDGPVDGEAMAERMRFVRASETEVSAVGRIEAGSAAEFEEFLASSAAGGARIIHLHSPGGFVEDALAMARAIRKAGLRTNVPADGYCASACPLVHAGGRTRSVGEGAWVGVHQVYTLPAADPVLDADASIARVQETIARCQRLLVDMGVDPALWVRAMETPANSLYVLTREDMVDYRVIRRFPEPPDFIGPPAPIWPQFQAPAERDASPSASVQGDDAAEPDRRGGALTPEAS